MVLPLPNRPWFSGSTRVYQIRPSGAFGAVQVTDIAFGTRSDVLCTVSDTGEAGAWRRLVRAGGDGVETVCACGHLRPK